jgi:hypothetical protein
MKHKRKAAVAAGILALVLGNKAVSQEIKFQLPYAEIPITEELPFQNGPFLGTDISFNIEAETKPEGIKYNFGTCFNDGDFSSVYTSFIDKINENLTTPLQIPLDDVKNLTDNKKLVFLSLLSNEINGYAYNESTNCCRHISSNIEKIANQIGLPAALVSGVINGVGHAYDVIKTEEGVSVIDSYQILSSKSKNVEKALEAYQSELGYPMFKQEFYKNSELKYALLTENGKNFLDFIGYNPSLEVIKDHLQNRKKYETDFKLEGNVKDDFFSFLAGFFGTYLKAGKMNETPSGKEILIGQAGINHQIIIQNVMSIVLEAGFVYGKMENSYFAGFPLGITVSTENEKGINLSARLSGLAANIPEKATLYFNNSADAGVSYSFNTGNTKLESYILSQFSFLVDNVETYKQKFRFNELEAGLKLSLPLKNGNFLFEPHYTKRIWEDEFGAKLRIGTGNVNGNLEASVSKSGYEFCPDKMSIDSGIDFSLNKLTISTGYKAEGTDYDGEKELTSSFYINTKVKLR